MGVNRGSIRDIEKILFRYGGLEGPGVEKSSNR